MPFDLEKTLHVFSKVENGGVQRVIVKHQNDHRQLMLIRQHLKEISSQFSQGNFAAPLHIHGGRMPGLAQLRQAKPGKLTVSYQAIPGGAEIRYSSDEPALISAIHRWFDAQLSDHAHHATEHPSHHEP